MDGSQVSVLEQTNQVGLSSLLESQDSRALETEIGLEVLGNLTDKALEGQLADEELSGFLVFTDLTESDGSGSVTMRLLHTSGSGGRFASGCKNEDEKNMIKNESRPLNSTKTSKTIV